MRTRIWIALHALVALIPLVGAVARAPDLPRFGVEAESNFPELSFADWRAEKIQPAFQAWFESRIGFRTVMARTDNSLEIELLGETPPGSYLVVGRDATYFSADDLRYLSTQERDLPPITARIGELTERLGSVRRKLAARGKALVVVIAASKSVVYPEAIPERWRRGSDHTAVIHQALRDGLAKNGVPFGDADALFGAVRESGGEREVVFARGGRHWTLVGACYALRDALREEGIVPECAYDMLPVDRSWDASFDLLRLQNSWRTYDGWTKMPITRWPNPAPPPGHGRRVLIVGTSFLWQLSDLLRPFVADPVAIFYNTTFFDLKLGKRIGPVDPRKPEWAELVLDRDLYVIEMLETFAAHDEILPFITELDRRLE